MKIEIKLADPKYCDGCPIFEQGQRWGYCSIFDLSIRQNDEDKFRRPIRCIDENGE
jgi:hypothetical protein